MKYWWTSGCGRLELLMTMRQAKSCTHSGSCDRDVDALSRTPALTRQLLGIDPDVLRDELEGYGAWDDAELNDHDQNLQRILWIAAGNIVDGDGSPELPTKQFELAL